MKKIISLFMRNYDTDHLVRNEVVPGAAWVINGEGVATRKWDGTCCMVENGKFYKRFTVQKGKEPPLDFRASDERNAETGKWEGWLPVGDGPEDRWHRAAYARVGSLAEGTYELLGLHINGNPESYNCDMLFKHGDFLLVQVPRDFEGLREYLRYANIEGIVWHHPDGRMVKIKKKDFGFKR